MIRHSEDRLPKRLARIKLERKALLLQAWIDFGCDVDVNWINVIRVLD